MSESEYTVAEIVGSRDWDGGGDSSRATTYWTFKVAGDSQQYEIGRKPGKPLTVGESFRAETKGEKYGKISLRRVQQFGGGFGGGPRPEDPIRSARILRQHSQDMAIQTLQLAHSLGVAPEVGNVKDIVVAVKQLADAFDRDVNTVATQEALTPEQALRRSEGAM